MAFKAENLRLNPDMRSATYLADDAADTVTAIRNDDYWGTDLSALASRQDLIARTALERMVRRETRLAAAGCPVHIVSGGATAADVRQVIALAYWDDGAGQIKFRAAATDVK